MSRTINTTKFKYRKDLKDNEWGVDRYLIPGTLNWLYTKTTKTKKKKRIDFEYHWMTTPSWWNNLFHTKPIRVKIRNWSRKIIYAESIDDIDNFIVPDTGNKPHKYYW